MLCVDGAFFYGETTGIVKVNGKLSIEDHRDAVSLSPQDDIMALS
jgi:hypothetical protein